MYYTFLKNNKTINSLFTLVNSVSIRFTNTIHIFIIHTTTINAIATLEFILTCYKYICNADSNAYGTNREPSPHPVPLTPRKTASIQRFAHTTLGQESSLTTSVH